MSTASKVTLALSVLGAAGVVAAVHNSQVQERARLKEGIKRDEQRQEVKRRNKEKLIQQKEIEEEMRRRQREAEKE